jgi:hypothetical protein
MRKATLQRLTFISKSLLWSLVFYFISMAIINWDEVSKGLHKSAGVNVAIAHIVPGADAQPKAGAYSGDNNTPQVKKDIQATGSVFSRIKEIAQSISGITGLLR